MSVSAHVLKIVVGYFVGRALKDVGFFIGIAIAAAGLAGMLTMFFLFEEDELGNQGPLIFFLPFLIGTFLASSSYFFTDGFDATGTLLSVIFGSTAGIMCASLLFIFYPDGWRASSVAQDAQGQVVLVADRSDYSVLGQSGAGRDAGRAEAMSLLVGDLFEQGASRSVVQFGLGELPAEFDAAVLRLHILESRKDHGRIAGVVNSGGIFTNPGLGNTLVIHIQPYTRPTAAAYQAVSIGNDPGVLIRASEEPKAVVTIDVAPAVRQALASGQTFVAFLIQTEIETDHDGLEDYWVISSANQLAHPVDLSMRPAIWVRPSDVGTSGEK